MNERILREILKAKLEIAANLLQILPPPIREQAESMQRSLLKVVGEVARDYTAEHPEPVTGKELKSVAID